MIVADASALFKLIVEEEHSRLVRQIFLKETSAGEPIVIPDVAVSEVLNILWVDYKIKKSINEAAFDSAIVSFDKILGNLDVIQAKALKDVALKIAVLRSITVYDSMYIASSLLKGAPLLSFDGEMRNAASKLGVNVLKLR